MAEDVSKIAELASLIRECGEARIKLEELLEKRVSLTEKANTSFRRELVSITIRIPKIYATYAGIHESPEKKATVKVFFEECPEIAIFLEKDAIYYPLCDLTVAQAVELLLYERKYQLLSKLTEELKKAYEKIKELTEIAERIAATFSLVNA